MPSRLTAASAEQHQQARAMDILDQYTTHRDTHKRTPSTMRQLPTPSSLPSRTALLADREPDSASGDDLPTDRIEMDARSVDERHDIEPFDMDDLAFHPHHEPPSTATSFFSSNIEIRRPFRARYDLAADQPAQRDTDDLAVLPDDHHHHLHSPVTRHVSFKRAFDQVSPASGTTPPVDTAFEPASAEAAPVSSASTAVRPHRRPTPLSFDSQRSSMPPHWRERFRDGMTDAEPTFILRRRSPVTVAPDQDDTRSKRRRPAEQTQQHESHLSSSFAPALGSSQDSALSDELAHESVLQADLDRIANSSSATNRRRSRLSLPSLRLGSVMGHHRQSGEPRSPPPAASAAVDAAPTSPSSPQRMLAEWRRSIPGRLRALSNASLRRSSDSNEQDLPTATSSAVNNSQPTSLRPRSARANPAAAREIDSSMLTSFWQDESRHMREEAELASRGQSLMQAAHARLIAAESALERLEAPRPSHEERIRRLSMYASEQESEDEGLPTLPSLDHVADPDRPNETPPVIGIRIGQRWTDRSSENTSDQVAAASPTHVPSPRSPRLQGLLSSLQARRPGLSRNATRVSPPPVEDRSFSFGAYDQADDYVAARRLGERLRDRRAAARRLFGEAADLPSPAESDRAGADDDNDEAEGARNRSSWRATNTQRRMRGPTERSNELWRQGVLPGAADISNVDPVSESMLLNTPDELAQSRPRMPRLRTSGRSEVYPWQREDSPSPRRRSRTSLDTTDSTSHDTRFAHQRTRPDASSSTQTHPQSRRASFLSTFRRSSRTYADSEMDGSSHTHDDVSTTGAHEGDFFPSRSRLPTIRLNSQSSRSNATTGRLSRAQSDAFVGADEEDDDDDGFDNAWSRARTGRRTPPLPLMLPSGSSGRRIVFPHPANASGPSQRQRLGQSLSEQDAVASLMEEMDVHRSIDDSARPDDSNAFLPSMGPSRLFLRRRNATGAAVHAESSSSSNGHRPRVNRSGSLDLPSINNENGQAQDGRSGAGADGPRPGSGAGLSHFIRGLRQAGFGSNGPAAGGTGSRLGALFDWDDDFPAFFNVDSHHARGGFGGPFGGPGWPSYAALALDPRNYLADEEFDTSYESLIRLSERLGDVKPKGVSDDKLDGLTSFKYRDWPAPARRVEPSSSDAEEEEGLAKRGVEKEVRCAICLNDYEDEDDILLGLCEHGFHLECLTAWFKNDGHCPICRREHS